MLCRNHFLRNVLVLALSALMIIGFSPVDQASAATGIISFVSDPTWQVYDPGLTTSYGGAQDVSGINLCPAPESCHYSLALLAAFPGATWIWVSGTSYDTLPADGVSYAFSKTIVAPGTPISGSISVAVDDLAEVYVNGQLVGTSGSVTNVDVASLAQRTLATFDLSPVLISGPNVITVLVHNADWHNGACGPCVWGQNPGAVGFGGTITYDSTPPDTTPPVVTVPGDQTLEATGPTGAAVTFVDQVTATDHVDGPITPSCAPASGSVFPLGTTTVNCSATDRAGNTGQASFRVTVVDTTPPVLTLPTNVVQNVLGPASNAAISYAVSATDLVDGAIAPVCTPNLGAIVPLGTTTVSCTATDAHGNSASGTFRVTMNTLPPTTKDQCKSGGWQGFNNPPYKNQGQCIKSVNG